MHVNDVNDDETSSTTRASENDNIGNDVTKYLDVTKTSSRDVGISRYAKINIL